MNYSFTVYSSSRSIPLIPLDRSFFFSAIYNTYWKNLKLTTEKKDRTIISFSNSAIRVWTKSLSGSFFLPTVFSGVNIDISTKCSISFLTIRESGETFTADQRSRKKYKLRKYHTIDRRRSQHWRAVSLVVPSLIAATSPQLYLTHIGSAQNYCLFPLITRLREITSALLTAC